MTTPDRMPESLRRHYLGLLGIEQWLPRGAEALEENTGVDDPADAFGVAALKTPPLPGKTAAQAAPADAKPVVAAAGISPAQRAALQAQLQGAGAEKTAPKPESPVLPPATPPASAAPVQAAGERMGCALLRAGDLLLVAAYGQVDAPGLTGAESEMLLRIAAAMRKGITPASPVEFSWPPPGVRLPGVNRPGAAMEALKAQLGTQMRQGARELAVLGDEIFMRVGDIAGDLGFARVATSPSLAVMQADPARKAEGWAALKVLQKLPES